MLAEELQELYRDTALLKKDTSKKMKDNAWKLSKEQKEQSDRLDNLFVSIKGNQVDTKSFKHKLDELQARIAKIEMPALHPKITVAS